MILLVSGTNGRNVLDIDTHDQIQAVCMTRVMGSTPGHPGKPNLLRKGPDVTVQEYKRNVLAPCSISLGVSVI